MARNGAEVCVIAGDGPGDYASLYGLVRKIARVRAGLPHGSRGIVQRVARNDTELRGRVRDCAEWRGIARNRVELRGIARNGAEWCGMARNGAE